MTSELAALRAVLNEAAAVVEHGGPADDRGRYRIALYTDGARLYSTLESSVLTASVDMFERGWLPRSRERPDYVVFEWRGDESAPGETRGILELTMLNALTQRLAAPVPHMWIVLTRNPPKQQLRECLMDVYTMYYGARVQFRGWRIDTLGHPMSGERVAGWVSDLSAFCAGPLEVPE